MQEPSSRESIAALCFAALEDVVRQSAPRVAASAGRAIQFELTAPDAEVWSFDATRTGRWFAATSIRDPALILRLDQRSLLELFHDGGSFSVEHCGDLDALTALRQRISGGFDPISIRSKSPTRKARQS